jgi:hypothetical protein
VSKLAFALCRVLATKDERKHYVVLSLSEIPRRLDVEAISEYQTEEEAQAEIRRLGGAIPNGPDMFLDFWD